MHYLDLLVFCSIHSRTHVEEQATRGQNAEDGNNKGNWCTTASILCYAGVYSVLIAIYRYTFMFSNFLFVCLNASYF